MQIDEVRSFLDSIDSINEGGCGIAALALKKVAESSGIEFKGFAFLYRDEWSLANNRSSIENGYDPEAPYHVIVNINGVWMDSEKEFDSEDLDEYYVDYDITELDLERCLENIDTWNSNFDRISQVPRIEKKLKLKLDVVM